MPKIPHPSPGGAKTTWRNTSTHPFAADLFPLDDAESKPAKDLADSISRHGLLESIKLWDGQIIDGRRRFRVCLALDVEPRFEAIDLADDEAALGAIVSLNTDRRKQLTRAQRNELIVKLRHKGMSQQRIAAVVGISKALCWKVIESVANGHSGTMTTDLPQTTTTSDGRSFPAKARQSYAAIWKLHDEQPEMSNQDIAKAVGVGWHTVTRALKARSADEAKAAEAAQVEQPVETGQESAEPTPAPATPPVQPVATGKPTLADVEYAAEITDLALDVREVVIGWVMDRLAHTPDDVPLDIASAFVEGFLEGAKVTIGHLTAAPKAPTPIKTKTAAKSKAKQAAQLVGAALTDAAAYGAAS